MNAPHDARECPTVAATACTSGGTRPADVPRSQSARHNVGLAVAGVLTAVILMLGCSLTGRGGHPAAPAVATTPADVLGDARVGFSFQATPTATPTAFASVRAVATETAAVTFRLLSINLGDSRNPSLVREQTVPVPPSGVVTASFTGVPIRTTIAQVEAVNATIEGHANFHGALDLVAGENLIAVNPTGSGMRHDLAAHMLENALISPTLFARLPASAAALALNVVRNLDRSARTVQQDALTAFARNLNPPRWTLTVEAIRSAQSQFLGISGPPPANQAWTPGETFVTENLSQDEVGTLCGWRDPG